MKTVKRFLIFCLIGLGIIFLGYQAYSALYSPYDTETISATVNEKKISVNGIFMRDEKIVEASHNGYIVHYLYSDGEKVGAGGIIAELYASEKDVLNYEKIKNLNKILEILNESQDKSSTLVTNADQITNQINNKIREFSNAVYNYDQDAVDDCKYDLQILLNRRNIITEKEENFSNYISQVKSEIEGLNNKISSSYKKIVASENGNFVTSADGYEESACYNIISSMSAADIESFIKDSKPDDVPKGAIGKLITDFDWYYTLILPIDKNNYNETIKPGTSLKMRFKEISDDVVTVNVAKTVLDEKNGKMAVFVKSNKLTGKFCSARKEKAEIIFSSVRGYKIKKSAVRIVNNQKGVYIVIGKQMFFRKIDVIYEEGNFVICKNSSGSDSIKSYDDVIVKGKDLYDGKNI